MFLKIFSFASAIIVSFTNFNYQNFEDKFKNEYLENHTIETLPIPFAPQAPFAEWNDQRQQDGCEESSVLMVMMWIKNENLSLEKSKSKITEIAEFEEIKYHHSVDTSAQDTLERIIKGFFHYQHAFIKNNIEKQDILFELAQGNAVIVPANGKLLQNPYFTSPGPDKHMLVIKGYDKNTQEFITNDPGTKMGENYRYDANILFDAITDYPTGKHEVREEIKKVMLVIQKK